MAGKGRAQARLKKAVKRLETALVRESGLTEIKSDGVKNLQQELNNLNSDLTKTQEENGRLTEQLSQAKSQNDGLQCAMDKISAQLDDALDTVEALLEDQPGT